MFYKILSNDETKDALYIPVKFFKGRTFANMNSVVISAGHREQSVDIVQEPSLNENELMISKNVMDSLHIPSDIMYQVKLERDSVRIGPVIGLLMATDHESLTRGRLRKLLPYCTIYPQIGGLMIAISEEGIDFEDKTVKGYYYNPDPERKITPWREGIFPLPDSIFHRVSLSEEVRLRLIEETNNCMFNSNFFNKWEFWTMMSKYKTIYEHLPDTRRLSSIEDVDYILSHNETAYIKPLNGTLSRGVYRVKKTDGIYGFQGNRGDDIIQISSREEAENHIQGIIDGHRYLVQQGINPLNVGERHMDFRVIMQKDNSKLWKCTGIVAFVGARRDICTNWGYTAGFEDIMAGYFNFTQKEIFRIKRNIIESCKSVCEVLDLKGENYGDFGFDVILDKSLKVWILEANKRHYHVVPLWNNDLQTFYEVKANPVKYATALSGFDVY